MATPVRFHVPGALKQVSFGTHRGQCLFRPDPRMRRQLLFILGVLAPQYNIELHACVLMSTHVHLVFTDHGETRRQERARRIAKRPGRHSEPEPVQPDAVVPCTSAFIQALNSWLAKLVQAERGVTGRVLSELRPSIQEVVSVEAAIDAFAYLRANSVVAGMVAKAKQYKGAYGFAMRGTGDLVEMTIPKPRGMGRRQPKEATPVFTRPGMLEHIPTGVLVSAIRHETGRVVRAHRAEHGRPAKPLGMRQVEKQDVLARAKTKPANKTLYIKAKCAKRYAEAMQTVRSFLEAHQRSAAKLRAGFTDVVFPFGTEYALRYQGARVAMCGAMVA